MKLALHRSITFWSGLLVIAFIGWAWWDSMRHSSWATNSQIALTNEAGALWFSHHGDGATIPTGSARYQLKRTDLNANWPPLKVLPPLCFVRGSYEPDLDYDSVDSYLDLTVQSYKVLPENWWVLMIPHWLILLTVAALWLTLLFWRARRRKRVVTP